MMYLSVTSITILRGEAQLANKHARVLSDGVEILSCHSIALLLCVLGYGVSDGCHLFSVGGAPAARIR